MSFYHLPHPWDPGYAIPRYVMAEPPERGTFTTAWMPRGTIPNLVPDYFANPMGSQKILGRKNAGLSGLGSLSGSTLAGPTLRGSTLAGSTLAGSSLGATEYELMPLGNGGVSGAITKFGAKTAKMMIAKVKQLPPQQRGDAMKQAMAQIDPSLRSRCENYALAAKKAGMPAPRAFELGLARALSEGLTSEFQRLGRSRELPQPSSLLGLGLDCARSRTQGAVGLGSTLAEIATKLGATTQVGAPSDRRPRQEGGIGGGGGLPTPDKLRGQTSVFEFPYDPKGNPPRPRPGGESSIPVARDLAGIPPHWIPWLNMVLTAYPGQPGSGPAPNHPLWQALGFAPGQPVRLDLVNEHTSGSYDSSQATGMKNPIEKVKLPDGSEWAVFITMLPSKTNPDRLGGWLIPWGGGGISGIVKGIVGGVGSAVCGLVTNPNFAAGAAGAATKTANPAGVATAGGILVGSQLCGGFQTPPPPPFFPPAMSSLLPLLLVGGGILAVVALTRGQ